MAGENIASVIKRGEICIQVIFHRTAAGLSVQVKARPEVEEFMQTLGGGERVDVESCGRYWTPLTKGQSLLAYVTASMGRSEGVTMEHLGHPLIVQDRNVSGGELVNLSFLKLVGVSDGPGVTFNVQGVYSLEALRKIRDRIAKTSVNFYNEHLRPVDLMAFVSTQEIKL